MSLLPALEFVSVLRFVGADVDTRTMQTRIASKIQGTYDRRSQVDSCVDRRGSELDLQVRRGQAQELWIRI